MNLPVLMVLLVLLPAPFATAHTAPATKADVSLDEQLGTVIPADVVFRDENGVPVNLRAHITRPTIIAPVYLHCMHVCPLLLTGLAEVLGKLELVKPGADFQVISLSFDENDTPAVAREKKPNYLKAVGKPFPPDAWKFLTGDGADINKFTDAVGFKFQRDGEDFSHPLALIVLAPGGKVVRYVYGTTFLPFTMTMALSEAAEGKIGSGAGRILAYCFSYDTKKQSYGFNVLKVTGTVIVITLASFAGYLMITARKRRGPA